MEFPFVSAGSKSNQRRGHDTDDQGLLTPASREKPLKGIPIPPASLSCLPRVPRESWSGTISTPQPVLFHTASTTSWGRAGGFNSTNRTFQTSLVPSPDPAQGNLESELSSLWFFLHFLNPCGWCSSALSRDRFQLLQPALTGCTTGLCLPSRDLLFHPLLTPLDSVFSLSWALLLHFKPLAETEWGRDSFQFYLVNV